MFWHLNMRNAFERHWGTRDVSYKFNLNDSLKFWWDLFIFMVVFTVAVGPFTF